MNTEAIAISQNDVRKLLSALSSDAALLYIYIHAGNPADRAGQELRFSESFLFTPLISPRAETERLIRS